MYKTENIKRNKLVPLMRKENDQIIPELRQAQQRQQPEQRQFAWAFAKKINCDVFVGGFVPFS